MKVEFKERLPEKVKLETLNKTISCANCEKDLVESIQIADIKKEGSYVFLCPHCEGQSFVHNFSYEARFNPIDCKIVDISQQEGKETWQIKLKKVDH